MLHRAQGVAVEIDDRDAERLYVRSCLTIHGVNESSGFDACGEDRAPLEGLELKPVSQHPPTNALFEVSIRAVGDRRHWHFWVIDEVLSDTRQIDLTVNSVGKQV